MLRLYRLLVTALFPILLPIGAIPLLLWPRGRAGLAQRLSLDLPAGLQGAPRLWLHAASVGEVKTAIPLANRLAAEFPNAAWVVSTMTIEGRRVAQADLAHLPNAHFTLLPLDVPFIVRRALKAFAPDRIVILETEQWACFYDEAKRAGAQLIIANGRISDKGQRRMRVVRRFLQEVLEKVDRFHMRTELDRDRLVGLWPGLAPRVGVAGNLKYDALGAQKVREDLPAPMIDRLKRGRWVLLASTHEGEEAALLPAVGRLMEHFTDVGVIVAPRAKSRFDEVAALMRNEGWGLARRSSASEAEWSGSQAILLDTLGELYSIYQYAFTAFVGGSLSANGGHNALEPAYFSAPVLFGPDMSNFLEERDLLLESGGAVQVENAKRFEKALGGWLADPRTAQKAGEAGRAAIEQGLGAADRIVGEMKRER